MQHYKKLQSGDTVIEFYNSWSGLETVVANGKIVSKKSSVWGTNHYFSVIEQNQEVRYVLTTKVNAGMQVLLDLRKNGQIINNNIPVTFGSGVYKPKIKRDNKAKKQGLLQLKEYQLEEALASFKEAAKFDPNDSDIYFNMACIYSVLEQSLEGFNALKLAKEKGFKDRDSILNHDMLAFLRLNPAFEEFTNSGFTKFNKALVEGQPKNNTGFTCHSEYGRLKSVFLKHVSDAFVDDLTINNNWEQLNYLDAPDLPKAKTEYQQFIQLLKSQDTDIHFLPPDNATGMDSVYCRDASIATNAGMILCNMGKPLRNTEPAASGNAFKQAGQKILGRITAPGTMEGGDVAWLDEKTLAVGHGYRSNQEGYNQLKTLLSPLGVSLIQVPLPHYKGQDDVFHLMSIFSPVDKDLAVVYSPLMPVQFRQELLHRGYDLVEVPEDEFESMGCNVLAIAPRKCLMVQGNPITKNRLESAGCTVYEYEGTEISLKGGGGPTCLTRPISRQRT